MKIKYAILGAGPSGLSLAHSLISKGVPKNEIVVFERENIVGGLCRSEIVDGAPLDIGGGHFLDLKRKNVLDFLFQFLPQDEWDLYDRVSKIRLRGSEVDHPLEANLWQFPKNVQLDYLESIAQAGCIRGHAQPESFAKWIHWKFGDRIAEEYMLPYNRKIWSMNPDALGTYWLYKLPNVSFRETLASCLEGRPMGSLPAHGTFLYPKNFGYGEVWRRMGVALGDALKTNFLIESIDLDAKKINHFWKYETLISTIPWAYWKHFSKIPTEIDKTIGSLKNASIDVDYHPETLDNSAHWIYEPKEEVSFHRLLLRSNFSKGSRGYWTETNSLRAQPQGDGIRFSNEYAYPVNTLNKPAAVAQILDWAQTKSVMGLGRLGTWEHMNSDVAVDQALTFANELVVKTS
jgi:protoporphyrinogen oxidase